MARVFTATCEYPTKHAAENALRRFQEVLRAQTWNHERHVLIVHVEVSITDAQIAAMDTALQAAGTGPLHEETPKT